MVIWGGRGGGERGGLTAATSVVTMASAAGASTPPSPTAGGVGMGAGASTGDAIISVAVVLVAIPKKLEILRGVFAGVTAFAATSRSCIDGFVGSAWV